MWETVTGPAGGREERSSARGEAPAGRRPRSRRSGVRRRRRAPPRCGHCPCWCRCRRCRRPTGAAAAARRRFRSSRARPGRRRAPGRPRPARGQRGRQAVIRPPTRGADEGVDVLGLTRLHHQAHPALGLVAHGIRRDLRQPQPAHLALREGQRPLHAGVRPHQPQVLVEHRQETGGLGERPLLQRVAPGHGGLARHGGHHEPLGVPAGGRPAVREQSQFHPAAVPVPQCHGAAPPVLPGRDPPRALVDVLVVAGAVGEQTGGGLSHDLGGRVAEQPAGVLAPLGHEALFAEGGRGRVGRSVGGVRLLRPLTRRGGKLLHRRSSRPR